MTAARVDDERDSQTDRRADLIHVARTRYRLNMPSDAGRDGGALRHHERTTSLGG